MVSLFNWVASCSRFCFGFVKNIKNNYHLPTGVNKGDLDAVIMR